MKYDLRIPESAIKEAIEVYQAKKEMLLKPVWMRIDKTKGTSLSKRVPLGKQ
jgi:hypothetical protein